MTQRRPRGAAAADAASWALASAANAETREQLAYLISQEDLVEQISTRFGSLHESHQGGHVFEWMHELTFNLDAIARDESVRAKVTTWLGQPHAPDDLRVVEETGHVLAEAQAKVVASVSQRVGQTNGLSDPKYVGMDRLVPSDHLEDTSQLLEKRLNMPEGPLHDRYLDTEKHLTDRLSVNGVESDPVSSLEVREAAADPRGYLQDHVADNHFAQVLQGAGVAAATGAVLVGATAVAQQSLRKQSGERIDWTSAAILAAKAGAVQGTLAVASNAISIEAQHRVAEGAVGAIEQLAGGTLPFAIARGAFDLSAVAHGFATGRLSSQAASVAATESISRTSAVWACAAAGQTLIPIPVVGAMIGGVVGQYGAVMMAQGLRIAIAARDLDQRWDAEYEKLLTEVAFAEAIAEEEVASLRLLAERHESAFNAVVLPSLELLEGSMGSGHPNDVLDELARITRQYGSSPIFTSVDEFAIFMRDPQTVLELRLSRP